jgi:hypothetical protein
MEKEGMTQGFSDPYALKPETYFSGGG